MGYYGKLLIKRQAQDLRKQGKSYNEIMRVLKLSKSTVSDWCKDIPLTSDQISRLYKSKTSGALMGSRIAAERKILARHKQIQELYDAGFRQIGKLSKRDRFIAGIALYSAEGTKTDKGCAFANSDPMLIKFMANWFEEFCDIPRQRYHGALWIHSDNDEVLAKQFWSDLIGISDSNFYKSYIVSNKSGFKKQKHSFGVFSLYVSDVKVQRKLMGWIGGILQKPMI